MKTFKPGDIVFRWFNEGISVEPVFGRVVRVNRVTVTVAWETSNTWRIAPHLLDIETDKEVIDWANERIDRRHKQGT